MHIDTRASFLIIGACFLWALDLSARYPLTQTFSFAEIIFLESLLGLMFLIPWLLKTGIKELKQFTKKDLMLGFFLGAVGMSAAGYLLNASITMTSPGTFSFFQIFQPLIVIYAATIFLKEKFDNSFLVSGIWVIFSALLMFSTDISIAIESNQLFAYPAEAMISLGVMIIWGLCTISAKKLLQKHSPLAVTASRWIFSLLMSSVFLAFQSDDFNFSALKDGEAIMRFIFISGIAGILSMWMYYKGLKQLPAWKVSVFELAYPAMGMVFASFYSFEQMSFLQNLGLLSFLTFISLLMSKSKLNSSNVNKPIR